MAVIDKASHVKLGAHIVAAAVLPPLAQQRLVMQMLEGIIAQAGR